MFFSPEAVKTAFRRQQTTLSSAFSGVVTVAGRRISQAAVRSLPITLAVEGVGAVEHRGLSVVFDKDLMPGEPVVGSVVVHQEDEREFIINSVSGSEAWCPSWTLRCIEKERSA